MKIRCPHCGRLGDLPDRLASGPHRLRCRRCQAHFAAPDWEPALSSAKVRFDGLLAPGPSPPARGPSDSQYELSFVFEDDPWDDDGGAAASHAAVSGSGEAEAAGPWSADRAGPGPAAGLERERERGAFLEGWSRRALVTGTALLALALLLAGFLLGLSAGAGGGFSTPVLAASAIVFFAFLFCGLSMVVLGALLARPAWLARLAAELAERANQEKAPARPERRTSSPPR